MSAHEDDPLPELPEDLRALVRGMQADPLEDDRVARVRQRLGPVIPPGGGSGGGGGSRGGSGAGAGAKLAAVGLVALVGLGIYGWTQRSAPRLTTSAPTVTAPVESAAPLVATAGPAALPVPSASASAVPDAPDAPVARPAVSSRPAPAASEDVVAEEDILHRARAALATSPQTALDLTSLHAKKFPHGVLGQEREIVAIEALARLGRSGEAATRAARFRTRFPASPYVQTLKNRGLVE